LASTELRLLPLLPLLATHLTATEIAAGLVLSPHAIKAEVKSIYRKLDASSRSQAITRARELGLLEGRGRSFLRHLAGSRPGEDDLSCGNEQVSAAGEHRSRLI
jgi:Bacterial regulatory proteins, luxR family